MLIELFAALPASMAAYFLAPQTWRCHSVALATRELQRMEQQNRPDPQRAAELLVEAKPCGAELTPELTRLAAGRKATAVRDRIPLALRGPRATPPRPQPKPPRERPAPVSDYVPPPAKSAEPRPLEPDNPEQVVYITATFKRQFPNYSDCPGVGWLALVDSGGLERRVTFDGVAPVSGFTRGRVPDLGHILTFSQDSPAQLFLQSLPCFVESGDACELGRKAGTFVVQERVRFNAGPGGGWHWQLCLVDQKEIRI